MLNINLTSPQITSYGVRNGLKAMVMGSLIFIALQISVLIAFMLAEFMLSESGSTNSTREVGFPIDLILVQLLQALAIIVGGFLIVCILTFVPTMVGGIFMVWAINKYSCNKPVSHKHGLIIGAVTGFITALLPSAFVGLLSAIMEILIPTRGGPPNNYDWEIYYNVALAVVAASVTGGFLGYKFVKQLSEKSKLVIATAGDDSVHFTAESQL